MRLQGLPAWDMDKQGTSDLGNKFGIDLEAAAGRDRAWYAPAMYNVVRQNGKDVHIVIKPDKSCVVNSGLGSVRGARMAECPTRRCAWASSSG